MYVGNRRIFGNLASAISKKDLKIIVDLSKKYKSPILDGILDRIYVPVSIFKTELSSLEAIVKYLRENIGLSNIVVSRILNRKTNTISATYQKSLIKHSSKLDTISRYQIPISIFKEGKLSVLENISLYLKLQYKLSNKEIGDLLNLDSKTVWTVLNRAERKING